MKILVTGAAGFVGKALVERLSERHEVFGLVQRQSDAPRESNARFVVADITKKQELMRVLRKTGRVDAVCHLAAVQLFSLPKPGEKDFFEVNVNGTKNLLECFKDAKRFVFASSTVVYGNQPGLVSEKNSLFPITAYAKSKLEAEKAVALSGVPFSILRFCTIYGPGRYGTVSKIISFVAKQRIIPLVGAGKRLHLVFLSDAVDAVEQAVSSPAAENQTYNVAGPDVATQKELVETIEKELGVRKTKISIPVPVGKPLLGLYNVIARDAVVSKDQASILFADQAFDTSKAQKELSFRPRIFVKEGIRQTIAWMKKQSYL